MKKILIVDDELEIRDLLKDKLLQNNFEILTASSGEEAIGICKSEHPDLVLLDIAMSGMDGYESCQKLKEDKATTDIPVLFLTGKDLDEAVLSNHCDALSVHGYIYKHSSLKDLLDKIKEVLFRASP